MNNDTTRAFPRTLEQAFGPNRWPISGPHRRPGSAIRLLGFAVFYCAVLAGAALGLAAVFGG